MEAKLVVIGGKANRSEVKLNLPAMIGRGRDADLTVSHATVSRHHCLVYELDGALVVRDNGSLNGTVVDGERVKEAVLRPGQSLTIGPLTFRAEYEHSGSFPELHAAPASSAAEAAEVDGESPVAEAPARVASPKVDASTLAAPPAPVGEARPTPPVATRTIADEPTADAPVSDNFDFLDDDVAEESSSAPSFGFLKDHDDEPAPIAGKSKTGGAAGDRNEEVFRLADEPPVEVSKDKTRKERNNAAPVSGRNAKPADEALPVNVPEGGAAKAGQSSDDAALDDFLNALGLDE